MERGKGEGGGGRREGVREGGGGKGGKGTYYVTMGFELNYEATIK